MLYFDEFESELSSLIENNLPIIVEGEKDRKALELFGVKTDITEQWRKSRFFDDFRNFLPSEVLRKLAAKHVGLTHGATRALAWFEQSFAGLIQTSRADLMEDRIIEF